jgi:phosphonate transport system substrate-binding protein
MADGACVDGLIYDYLARRGNGDVDHVKVVHRSEPFGIPPVVVSRAVDPILRNQLRSAFLKANDDGDGREVLRHLDIDAFVLESNALYDGVRSVVSVP